MPIKYKANVYNLSNIGLTRDLLDLLGRGLGLNVSLSRVDKFQIETD